MLIKNVSALAIMCLLLAACGSGSGSSGAGETKRPSASPLIALI
jgi:hypothetical protein